VVGTYIYTHTDGDDKKVERDIYVAIPVFLMILMDMKSEKII